MVISEQCASIYEKSQACVSRTSVPEPRRGGHATPLGGPIGKETIEVPIEVSDRNGVQP